MHRSEDFQGLFIPGLSRLTAAHFGCVVTIGSFDGVHLGHQAILSRLKQVGQSRNLPTLVMVFEPQPYEFFSKEKAPARLMRLREKVDALFAQGVDRVLCIKFDKHFRQMSAQAFIDKVLVKKLGVAHLEIGDDFRFGCDRTGDFKLLQQAGQSQGFTVSDTKTLQIHGQRASSTRVRELLELGQLSQAGQVLGQSFSIAGRVVYGKQLGRTIGVPTANVGLGRYRSPIKGVYAVVVDILGGEQNLQGVANVGVRPTVGGKAKPLLEVNIFDFKSDIYGRWIRVRFCHKLRSEKKFESFSVLKQQIEIDIEQSKEYFSSTKTTER